MSLSPSKELHHAAIAGERVLLRPQSTADVERAYGLIRGNDEILRWLLWDGPLQRSDLEEHYSRWITPGEHGRDYHFAIAERESGDYVGSLGLRFAGHPESGDLGYWLGTPYQGRGHGTEAVRLATYLGFRHLGAEILCAWVFVGNQPSRNVLERNGFQLVRTACGVARKRDQVVDEWYFALTRGEWERALQGWRPAAEDVSFAPAGRSRA